MTVRFAFTDGHAELTARPRHLHVIEHGFIGSVENMDAYLDVTLEIAGRHGLRRVLVDTRATTLPDPGDLRWKAVRDCRWERIASSGLTFAFVVADDIAATRVSMTARGAGATARGFADLTGAAAWLLGR